MSDDILGTIEVLSGRVIAKEEDVNKLKRLVNELCEEAGVPIRYSNISGPDTGLAKLRSDLFYGETITGAIRYYLERRKAADLGAASAWRFTGQCETEVINSTPKTRRTPKSA